MPKALKKSIVVTKSSIKQEVKKVNELKNKTQDEKLLNMINDLISRYDDLASTVERLEEDYRAQMKKMLINPYYQRLAKNPKEKKYNGLTCYNLEAIYPNNDSLFC